MEHVLNGKSKIIQKLCLVSLVKKNPRSKPVNQYSKDGEFIRRWESTREVERELGFLHTNISDCANGKQKTAKGFIWKYAS